MSDYNFFLESTDYRRRFPKVRGGWTKDKIKRELKKISGKKSELIFHKEIAKYDTPEEFIENMCYHGSGGYIGDLKPSIVLGKTANFGGGYEDRYYGVSLSKDKEIASGFTGASATGSVAPVIIKRDAKIKELPNIKDACELEDIIEDLWQEGIDVVKIGEHSKPRSEQEMCVLNPTCIVVGRSESFRVYQKAKMPSLSKEELTELWLNSSEKYKELAIESWENSNESFKAKYGKEKSPETRWNSKQQKIFDSHQENVKKYKERTMSNDIKDYLNKEEKISIKKKIKP